MTYGELKETDLYINAEDVDVCVNGEGPINEEYYYVGGICLLDNLLVVGTGIHVNGTLLVDLISPNWDSKPCNNDIDYFKEVILPNDIEGIRPDIANLINNDIKKYREHMIKHYNGDEKRGTDEFCFKKFLNDYSTAINVFELHKEYNCKGSFNRFISSCWQFLNVIE